MILITSFLYCQWVLFWALPFIPFQDHKEEVTCVTFNGNDSYIASGSTSGEIVLHNVTTNLSSTPFGHGSSQVLQVSIHFMFFVMLCFQLIFHSVSVFFSPFDIWNIPIWRRFCLVLYPTLVVWPCGIPTARIHTICLRVLTRLQHLVYVSHQWMICFLWPLD